MAVVFTLGEKHHADFLESLAAARVAEIATRTARWKDFWDEIPDNRFRVIERYLWWHVTSIDSVLECSWDELSEEIRRVLVQSKVPAVTHDGIISFAIG